MGNISSTQIIQNNNISQNTLDQLNQTVSTQVTKIIMSQQTQSMVSITPSSIQVGQVGSISIGTVNGDAINSLNLNIDMNQNMTFNSNMSSAQNSSIQASIAQAISGIATASLSAEQKSGIVSATIAKQENARLALSGGNSNNDITNTSVNKVDQEFTNIVTNIINNTPGTADIKSCIVEEISNKSISAGNISATNGGRINSISMTITDTSIIVRNCIFNSIQGSGILNKIAITMGLSIIPSGGTPGNGGNVCQPVSTPVSTPYPVSTPISSPYPVITTITPTILGLNENTFYIIIIVILIIIFIVIIIIISYSKSKSKSKLNILI